MGKLTAKEVAAKSKGEPGRFADGEGLYFVVPKSGKPFWMLRYTANKKRKEMTLAKYSDLSLADARAEAAIKMKQFRDGLDPLVAKKRAEQAEIKSVDDLFADWHLGNIKRLKHHEIPERIYRKDIAPHIGSFNVDSVTARDIRAVLQAIAATNRPAIANDALMYSKQLFNHGIKLDLLSANPASAFSVSDAGGVEKSKDRALTIEELSKFFKVARENSDSFSRDNYLACSLLVTLGIRKSELAEAPWKEFDLEQKVWNLSKERSKSGVGIAIPLPEIVMGWIQELKIRACGSEYVFPSRRSSKNPHMGKDTLNRAITKLFGHEAGKKKQPPNLMGDMAHFTVHDLRRTCRTLLAKQGTLGHVAERCLNHKLKGVEGIYNQHDYFEERKEAVTKLSEVISPMLSR
ncbi:tyrosine-type recombinase/integrase [Shewanella electrodiphila]|uniref:Tyrosine-type recombinase/integrase n=1 Tax=Shewanella electrodiphila TaxID=934143 RepID=A0ABT0KUC4_9GAMM|nr:site-specific integrase [Shewanella electrodiphila]MCL1047447.1 tyrosine-type recombinase/integrase [Shewanella electrodiphila]